VLVCDTSGLLAYFDASDAHCTQVTAVVEAEPGPFVVCPYVVARQIDLPDASMDIVVFRMGLMLVTEPKRVLEECHRVLRSGGMLGVAVWAAPQHNPWLTSVGMAAMMHGLVSGGPPTGPGGPFSLADPPCSRG
jgi:ubiquinone/menaquinone biosynthesis C-methylase UbiE